MNSKQKKNYTLKIFEDKKEVVKISTHSLRKFVTRLGTINFPKTMLRIYLRVSYGVAKDQYGEMSTFYNECWCSSKEELLEMFEYFKNETIE